MSTETLPAVAKNIHLECKKCGAGRYHVVLAHKTATSAKVRCEICKSIKTYSIASKRVSTGGSAQPRKRISVKNSENQHQKEYESLIETLAGNDPIDYNMKTKFQANQKLQHPKFGIGIVKNAQSDKIEVVFPDEVRSLVHNRA